MTVISNRIDFFFIKFPFIFPLIYAISLYFFSEYETFIIVATILILAEPHFAATWPFMINKKNKDIIFKNKNKFIVIPILIIFFSLLCFFYSKKEFLLFFFMANMYHVTKQSTGITKLYIQEIYEKNFHTYSIYFYNILLFFVGIFRFYIPVILEEYLIILNIFLILIFLLIIFYCYYKFKKSNLFTLITGLVIFYPIAFVSNPVHAIIMGVTMHYSQYLFLTFIVGLRREKEASQDKKNIFFKTFFVKFFTILIIYSIIMTIFSVAGKNGNLFFKQLIVIPIIFQLLHFYFDGLLWKFSVQENRDNTLKYIFNN